MGSNTRFRHESLQDAKTIKTLLGSLAKGFAKGSMTLGDDDDELELKTGGLMDVRVKAEREDGRCVFSLRISWPDPTEEPLPKGKPRIDS
ncbi:MAG: amphi-Trp domain-containing protein [Mangrovicoccus sp.]